LDDGDVVIRIRETLTASCSSAGLPISPGWNCQCVEYRLLEAAETLNRMTGPDWTDARLPQINRMHEALSWLGWLQPDLARLMLSRAQCMSWKALAHCSGVSVRTAQRQYRYALSVIVWRLHGRNIPRTWSRQFLLARVATLSRGN